MADWHASVIRPVCPTCSADLADLAVLVPPLDWRDEHERELGANAYALQRHLADLHPVVPAIGDVVMYYQPWRGLRIGDGPLVVRGITTSDHGLLKFWLADPSMPNRESRWFWPSIGRDDYPITFDILSAYVAPPVESTLFDLLGDEWADTPSHAG